jgi:hypothetical protein
MAEIHRTRNTSSVRQLNPFSLFSWLERISTAELNTAAFDAQRSTIALPAFQD